MKGAKIITFYHNIVNEINLKRKSLFEIKKEKIKAIVLMGKFKRSSTSFYYKKFY